MKAQETAKYRLLAVDCCDGLVDAIKSRALGGCISAVLRTERAGISLKATRAAPFGSVAVLRNAGRA